MLRHIFRNSKRLEAFLLTLNLDLYEPLRRHVTNIIDALLVCDERKTLSALHRQLVCPPSMPMLCVIVFGKAPGKAPLSVSKRSPILCLNSLELGDFRVHSVEATEKWYALAFLTLAYPQLRLNVVKVPSSFARIMSCAERKINVC